VEKFDMIFEVDANENSDPNVSKMLANSEDLASRPDTSIANPEIESFFELSLIPASPIGRQVHANP